MLRRAAMCGRRPGQVGQDADLHDIIRNLGVSGAGGKQEQSRKAGKPMHEDPPVLYCR